MTLAALKRRVKFWMKTLEPLGLVHWEANVRIVEEPSDDATYSAKAAVSCSSHYDAFWMEFSKGFLDEATPEEVDDVIIHELIHVLMRDFDEAVHAVNEYLGEPALSMWQETIRHQREGLVDRLARTLNLTSRSNVVRS